MKKLLLFILVLFSATAFGQTTAKYIKVDTLRTNKAGAIHVKKPLILMEGDSLYHLEISNDTLYFNDTYLITTGMVISLSGDTLFVGADTILLTNHWTLTGSDIENNNTGKVILPKDSTYFSGIPDEATKVGRIMHVNQYGKIEWVSPGVLGDSIDRDRAASPTSYTTWVRDTTDGDVYLADSTDQVGIGTSNPRTALEVTDAILSTGTFGAGWTEPDLYYGTRLLWYPRKAAFRVGYTNSHGWDNDSIGAYSFVAGFDCKAKGIAAFAMGQGSEANGDYSVAIGSSCEATGSGSLAFGIGSTATNMGSFAAGEAAIATGYVSAALCAGKATGTDAFAAGNQPQAMGEHSVALGSHTLAKSAFSTAIGRYNIDTGDDTAWVATDPVFSIGNGTSDIARSNILTVLKNGRMGLGITPTAKLHIFGNATTDNLLYVSNDKDATKDSTFIIDKRGFIFRGADGFIHNFSVDAAAPNLFIGINSGNFTLTGNQNTGFGYLTGQSLSTGAYNNMIGNYAGKAITTAQGNNLMGYYAGGSVIGGHGNTAVGESSLRYNATGSYNVAIGWRALFSTNGTNITNSVGVGAGAGYLSTGSSNIFIGCNAGYNTTLSNRLVIDNANRGSAAADSTASFIWGNMSAMQLGLNAKVGIKNVAPDSILTVTGSGHFTTNLKVDNTIKADSLYIAGNAEVENDLNVHSGINLDGSLIFLSGGMGSDLPMANYNIDAADTVNAQIVQEKAPDHAFYYFEVTGNDTLCGSDPSVASATPGVVCTYEQFNEGSPAAWDYTTLDESGFSIDATDTITYLGTSNAHAKFTVNITWAGTNSEELFLFRIFNITDNVGLKNPSGIKLSGITGEPGNFTINAHDLDADSGDEYILQFKSQGGAPINIYYISIECSIIHY